MGIIRLTLITAVLIWLAMMYFGRDDGLPQDRIGRDAPAAAPQPAPMPVRDDPPPEPEPEPKPVVADTPAPAPVAPAPTPPPEPEPEPEPEPRQTITFTPLSDAVADAVEDALSAPDPAPDPDPVPAEDPAPAAAPGSEFVVDAAPEPDPQLYVTGSRVNVRAGPSTVYEAITSLTRGTSVADLGDAGEGWRMIRLPNGGIGYMSGDFLSPVSP